MPRAKSLDSFQQILLNSIIQFGLVEFVFAYNQLLAVGKKETKVHNAMHWTAQKEVPQFAPMSRGDSNVWPLPAKKGKSQCRVGSQPR